MAGSALVFVLVALAASWRSVFAAEYEVVADDGCSDFWTYECSYSLANQEFFVGDILVFTFDTSKNTVAIVTESDYSTCEDGISLPEQMSYTSPTNTQLTSAEDYYFVSIALDTNGNNRCFQKLHITVQSSPPTPPPPDGPSSDSPPAPTPPTPDAPSSDSPPAPTPPPPGAPSSNTPPPPSKSNSILIIEVVGGSAAGVVAFSFKIWLLMYCVKKKHGLNADQVGKIGAEAAKA